MVTDGGLEHDFYFSTLGVMMIYHPVVNGGSDARSELGVPIFAMKNGEPVGAT